jgi:hypothetical protein
VLSFGKENKLAWLFCSIVYMPQATAPIRLHEWA